MNWNYNATVPAILGGAMAADRVVPFPAGNLYAASYPTMVAAVETGPGRGRLYDPEILRTGELSDIFPYSVYRPGRGGMPLDEISVDVGGSITGSRGDIIHADALGSGRELFPDGFSCTLDPAAGRAAQWRPLPPVVQVPDAFFDAGEIPDDEFAALGLHSAPAEKLNMFKSELETLLEEMCEA